MDVKTLYDKIALRKGEMDAPISYIGGNTRIDRAATLIKDFGFADSKILDIG